ncbi:hypothetical protein GUITHDRAFT_146587 [Guillardia theta CCMP2712]|uniref:EF-hand domain-containing protein n=1 Tax=Guillardia theta (strain CCMP2712) TaxID=905079 RepID=L1IHA7_GUITC|nr:hypothetical protein GUITHDRAFT_146587 [Guillardia theta CCMP2712]EKX35279.1 hypothetical protein GUITHDRAFT_146587 [Guillardia theta CCMP2712]|eukprot:XP_005822259.1 hypothetical protein GUITHDRAFT_146587 [Guillardia theta CCMP2712]
MGDEKSQYVCKLKSIEQAFDVGESVLDPVLQRVKQKPIKELSHVDFKIQLKELEIDITERDFFCALERHGRDMAIMRNSFLDSKVSGQIMNSIVDRARLNAKWSIWLERRFEKNKVLSLIKHELEQKQNYKSTLPITDFEVAPPQDVLGGLGLEPSKISISSAQGADQAWDAPAQRMLFEILHVEDRTEIETIFAVYDFHGNDKMKKRDLCATLISCGWNQHVLDSLGISNKKDEEIDLESFLNLVIIHGVYRWST